MIFRSGEEEVKIKIGDKREDIRRRRTGSVIRRPGRVSQRVQVHSAVVKSAEKYCADCAVKTGVLRRKKQNRESEVRGEGRVLKIEIRRKKLKKEKSEGEEETVGGQGRSRRGEMEKG